MSMLNLRNRQIINKRVEINAEKDKKDFVWIVWNYMD